MLTVSIDEPLQPLVVEPRYREVRLVVSAQGAVIGEVTLPALAVIPPDLQRAAIARELADVLWRRWLERAFERATHGATVHNRDTERSAPPPSVSVIVATRNRPDRLRACLESLLALATAPDEIVVVDNCPGDERTRDVCSRYAVRYVREDAPGAARARNRGILEAKGDLLAFTDDDCVVDTHWLDRLHNTFADPLVMAVTGYIGPLELETRAQYLFELHGGFERHFQRVVFDGLTSSPVVAAGKAGASANVIFRRRAFEEVGLFAEDLGPGTPARSAEDSDVFYRVLAAGYRIVFDPARVVSHRHRRDYPGLRSILFDYTVAVFAYTTRCLFKYRELGVLRVWAWWWFRHIREDLARILRRDERRVPFGLVMAELAGTLVGPWRLLRSRRLRRRLPPLKLPDRDGTASPTPMEIDAADPPLSVVVPSHNRRDHLQRMLQLLAEQTYPADRFEVSVVLDGSTDDSADMLRSLEMPYTLRVIEHDRPRGAAASRNAGARAATNPIVVMLDDDIAAEPPLLAGHASAHRSAKHEHVALGYYPAAISEPTLWALSVRAWWEDHFRRKSEPGHVWTFPDFVSGNTSLPRALFFSVGGFDEIFEGRGREDWELGLRLLERGVRLAYYPTLRGWHHLDTSFDTALRHSRRDAHLDVQLACKHPRAKAHLPLAAVARALGEGRSPRALLAYRHPEATEHAARMALPLLAALEALRLRGRWHALAQALRRHAYVLGLTDVLSTPEEFLTFVAPIWRESVEAISVSLDRFDPIAVGPGGGSIELALTYGDTSLARLVALDPTGQWDWDDITARVSDLADVIRPAVLRTTMNGGGTTADQPTSPRHAHAR